MLEWILDTLFVFCCCVTNYYTHIYRLTISMSQDSGLSLTGSSAQDLTRLQPRCQLNQFPCKGSTGEESTSKLTQAVGRIYCFRLWSGGSNVLVLVSWKLSSIPRGFTQLLAAVLSCFRLPKVPCHVGFPKMVTYLISPARSLQSQFASKTVSHIM